MVNLLASSSENAKLSFVAQVFFRGATIACNALVARKISQEAFGLINVRLLLLESILLLLSREAIRRACQQNVRNHDWPKVINLIWTMVPFGFILSIGLGFAWWSLLEKPEKSLQHQYLIGIIVLCISCIIELFGEVPNLLAKVFFFNKLRLVMSLVYMVVRQSTYVILILYDPTQAINAFSVAQFISAIVWACGYHLFFIFYLPASDADLEEMECFEFETVNNFLPTLQNFQIPPDLVSLAISFFGTVLAKHVLQEGERYLMTIWSLLSLKQQAVFDLIQNVGTMPIKIMLKPIEDPIYFYFAQIFVRGGRAEDADPENRVQATQVIESALNSAVFVGLLIIAYGFFYSLETLKVYGGKNVATYEGCHLLQAHGLLFVLVALLTVAENFSLATMNESQLRIYNALLAVLPFVYLVCALYLTRLFDDIGLIIATCLCAAIRLIFSLYMMKHHYKGTSPDPTIGLFIPFNTCLNLVGFSAIGVISKILIPKCHDMLHLLTGIMSFLLSMLIFYKYQNPELWNVLNHVRIRRSHFHQN